MLKKTTKKTTVKDDTKKVGVKKALEAVIAENKALKEKVQQLEKDCVYWQRQLERKR